VTESVAQNEIQQKKADEKENEEELVDF